MKRWLFGTVLIICLSILVACGNQGDQLVTHTNDVQEVEEKQDTIIEEGTTDNKEITNEKHEVDQQEEAKKEKEVAQSTPETNTSTPPPVTEASGKSSANDTTPPPVVTQKPAEVEQVSKVTISIDTLTLLNNKDKVKANKQAYIPSDGWILTPITVEIQVGDSVFDVLSRVTRERRIHMEYQGANQSIYNSVYIQGIGQLYEFDCGELSGWMYTIDDAYVAKGASGVKAEDGMNIEWRYTCDLGRDLGL